MPRRLPAGTHAPLIAHEPGAYSLREYTTNATAGRGSGAFLIGLACFVGGLVIEFSVSQRLGWTMIGVDALIADVSRLLARRL